MELCVATLSDVISEKYRGFLPPEQQCLHQMAAGVEHIHSNNWVHRDIKPDNILICAIDGWVRLKISDFGLSKKSVGEEYSISGLVGTPVYLAPELVDLWLNDGCNVNESKMTNASDVFALGCVFFYFLTKKHPFGNGKIIVNISSGRSDLSGTSDTSALHCQLIKCFRFSSAERSLRV